jgi:Bifunctional DNA primase/polymerase, N-terminal/AAA domain/Primase C terminal 1 (PriCT-1)
MAASHSQPTGGLSPEIVAAASRGWRLHPIRARDKVPLVKNWPNAATTDIAQLEEWTTRFPACNWGVATGPASGVFIMDVDGNPGRASLKAYQQQGFELPDTLTVVTGNGRHLYFQWAPGASIRNSAGQLAAGLDIRVDRGCAVIPPSIHSNGRQYSYLDANAPIAEAPAWLIAKLTGSLPVAKVVTLQPARAIPEGKRNSTLTSLAGAMRRKGISPAAIEAAMLAENQQRCNPPLPEDEVRGIAKSAGNWSPAGNRRADVVCLADVKAQPIHWLWEPYIPLKMLTLLSGDPGVGKTALMMALAASLTRGDAIGSGQPSAPSNVLYLTNENSPQHVLRPRFDSLGGDPARFFLLRGVVNADESPGSITLKDTEQLEDAIRSHEIRLVVIDPLQSFLGAEVDAHRANETRPVLDGLIRLAERTGCAIVITRHLSKGIGGSATYRGMGSIDITGAARCELFVGLDPQNPDRVILAHSKSNLSKFGPSLVFSIGDGGNLSWHGESKLKANDLLALPANASQRSALDEAAEFLKTALAGGSRSTNEIKDEAKANGISDATLRRAKKSLRIVSKPSGLGEPWTLELPSVAQDSSESLNTEK